MKTTVTLTTIHVPNVIEKVEQNRKTFGHSDVDYVVVGDKRSPQECEDYLSGLKSKGVKVLYLSADKQNDYLGKHPAFRKYLPFNTFARRNVADLIAYENGAEIILRMDDDNFPVEHDDFIGGHRVVGTHPELPTLSSSDGWYNCCELLETKGNVDFYPRGYPYPKRWKPQKIEKSNQKTKVMLCAGLWTGDPDVDAVTRLHKPIEAIALKAGASYVALAKGTWCPINTQNTSYHRDLIPASFVSPNVGRYDDIFSGFLLRLLMDHFGDTIVYGRPILHQDRNQHNLWKDLEYEMFGNQMTPHLIEILRECKIKSLDYASAYTELAQYLKTNLREGREGFQVLWEGMNVWAECFR